MCNSGSKVWSIGVICIDRYGLDKRVCSSYNVIDHQPELKYHVLCILNLLLRVKIFVFECISYLSIVYHH
jgi:hypothetical protein